MSYWNIVLCKKNGNKYYSKMDSCSYHMIDGRLSKINARIVAEKLLKNEFGCDNYTSYTLEKGNVNSCYDKLSQNLEKCENVTDVIKNEFSVLVVTSSKKIEYHKNVTIEEINNMIWDKNIVQIFDLESQRTVKDLNLKDKADCFYRNTSKLTLKKIGE